MSLSITFDSDKPFGRRLVKIAKKSAEQQDTAVVAESPLLPVNPYEDFEKMDFNFRGVIEEIIKLQKPLIVHNGFQDILHVSVEMYVATDIMPALFQLYDKFVCDLPESSSEFKRSFHELFPRVYDTKLIV